ncbi:MFS transporter [Albimonas sp. CAU 1670]|uniref:MFS transporter n=1 Tax=Albimonas sp. CAU 1670 TaxID=3032599 RepID=UPI0023DAEABC|nr:MFS transporter [Albimonas sp. CAU 1670]MDF2232572.1 MFS transporter [Albimonas sp. CAU 1670]
MSDAPAPRGLSAASRTPGAARLAGMVALTQLIGWGSTYSIPAVLARPMAEALGMPLALAFGASSAFLLAMAGVSPWLGPVFERRGARPLLALGSVVLAAGLAVLALSPNWVVYFLAWVVMGAGGAMALSNGANVLLAERLGPRARRGISAAMLVSGLASTCSFPVMLWLEPMLGWRGTLGVYALANLLVCAPLHWFVPGPRPAAAPPPAPAPVAPPGEDAPDPALLGRRAAAASAAERARFGWLALAMSLAGMISWGLGVALPETLAALGAETRTAVMIAAVVGVGQVAARAVDFALGAPLPALSVAILAALAMPVAFAVLGLGQGAVVASVIFAAIYGAGTGLLSVCRATLPLELFDPAAYARMVTRLALPMNLAFAAAGPLFGGLLAAFGAAGPIGAAFLGALGALAALLRLRALTRRTA